MLLPVLVAFGPRAQSSGSASPAPGASPSAAPSGAPSGAPETPPTGAPPASRPGAPSAPPAPTAPSAAPDAPVTPVPAPRKREGAVRYGTPTPLPRREGTLRLACYNVENLFDDRDDPEPSGEYDDAKMTVPESRRRALGEAIRALDADVLCLEEVESLDALRWFRDQQLSGMGYEWMASIDVGYPRGVEQCVLSRFPILHAQVWKDADLTATAPRRTGEGWSSSRTDSGTRFQRSPLFVQVKTPEGYALDLFVVHHKAGGKEFAFQREAEALGIIDLVKQRLAEDPNANIAVLGDFNASPSEKSVKVYLDPAFGGLANAWEFRFDRNQPRDTFVTHASGRVIDYIFMSEGLKGDVVPRSFFILATFAPGDDWNWRTDPPPERYASDHRPLAVDLIPRDAPTAHPNGAETKLWGADGRPGGDGIEGPGGARAPAPPSAPPATTPPAPAKAPAPPAAAPPASAPSTP